MRSKIDIKPRDPNRPIYIMCIDHPSQWIPETPLAPKFTQVNPKRLSIAGPALIHWGLRCSCGAIGGAGPLCCTAATQCCTAEKKAIGSPQPDCLEDRSGLTAWGEFVIPSRKIPLHIFVGNLADYSFSGSNWTPRESFRKIEDR